jgi:hypothetical protein
MSDWMDDREARIRAAQEALNIDAARQQKRRAVINEKSRSLLDALTAQVSADVDRYRQKAEGRAEGTVDFTAHPSGGFSLSRSHFPAASVRCRFDPDDAGVIRADYSFTPSREGGTSGYSTSGYTLNFDIDVNAMEELQLCRDGKPFLSLAAASQEVIERVLYPP